MLEIPIWPQAGERELELLRSVLESSQWGGFHPFVEEFEESFATYQGARYGISTANGTLSLELALSVLGIGPGDEVIVPAISFISSATSVSRVGALPVFVDIEADSLNLDPERIGEAMTPHTKAIMPVHFGGTMASMEAILKLAAEHRVAVIEDAAHAHGSAWSGKPAGSFGVCNSFSFQNGKVLCSGEGGMLVTNNASLAAAARSVANQGRKAGESFYAHYELGTNFRLTGFQAAVLLAQFENLPAQIEHRTKMAAMLKERLADVEEIRWQAQPPEQTQNPFYLLPARLERARADRDAFCQHLAEAGIPSTPFYPFPLYGNPFYQRLGKCRMMPCPVAESCVQDAFWLPHRLLLSEEETMEGVAREIRKAIAAG